MFLYKNEEMPQQKTNTVTQTAGLENQEILENVKAIFTYFRMTLKMVSINVPYLYYQPMGEKIKTWTLRFPLK